jgi:hypothetical protein
VIRGLLLAIVASAGCADEGGPRLEAVTPTSATRTEMVTLSGHGLCGAAGDCAHTTGEVLLGRSPPQVHATVVRLDATSVDVVIPQIAPLGPTELMVTVDDRASNALAFEVLP